MRKRRGLENEFKEQLDPESFMFLQENVRMN